MERPRYLDKNYGDEGLIRVGLIRCLYKERRICEHKRLFWGIWLQKRYSAAEFVLRLPSWNTAELQVRFTLCPLHFRVQSWSNFWPDGPASPLLPHCQVAFCSRQQLLNPTADPNPSSAVHLPLLILSPLSFAIFFLLFLFVTFSSLVASLYFLMSEQ